MPGANCRDPLIPDAKTGTPKHPLSRSAPPPPPPPHNPGPIREANRYRGPRMPADKQWQKVCVQPNIALTSLFFIEQRVHLHAASFWKLITEATHWSLHTKVTNAWVSANIMQKCMQNVKTCRAVGVRHYHVSNKVTKRLDWVKYTFLFSIATITSEISRKYFKHAVPL